MYNDIVDILCKYSEVPREQISQEINVITDLGLTSMDFMEVICDFEEKYDIEVPECDFRKLVILKDIVEYLDARKLLV